MIKQNPTKETKSSLRVNIVFGGALFEEAAHAEVTKGASIDDVKALCVARY